MLCLRGEAQRAKSGSEVLGDRAASTPHQLGSLGSAVCSPSGVRGGTLATKRFSCILQAPDGLSRNLLGAKLWEACCPWPPLNPSMLCDFLCYRPLKTCDLRLLHLACCIRQHHHGYGYGVGMGTEIQSPRQPCRSQ